MMHFLDDEPDYTRILDNIATSQDIDKLMVFVANAQKKNVVIVRDAALIRLKELLPAYKEASFEHAFWDMFSTYQTVLIENRKSTVKLTQARKTAIEVSEIEALANWVESKSQAWAFEFLMTHDNSSLTAEGLVLQFPRKFASELRSQAKLRIKSFEQKVLEMI